MTNQNRIRLGILGCGGIARLHVQRLLADPRSQIVALYDSNRAAAERLRDEFVPTATVAGSDAELIEAGSLDAAVICTPTMFHFDQVTACHQRGLHVLCEKPLADTRERILALISLAQGAGSILSIAYQRRYDANFRTLRREVQSGRWGTVKSVTTHNSERWQQTIHQTWRNDPVINPGGFLGDAGSHKIDMLFFVTGLNPVEVFAYSDRRGSDVEIVSTITGRLSGNAALSMSFIGDAQHWREDFQVHCADADLSIREGRAWIGRNNRFELISDLEPATDPDVALLDMITRSSQNAAPASCALPVYDFTQAVLESARRGRVVACG